MKTRIYKHTCIQCGKMTETETALGVEGGDYEDYLLRKVSFECEHCGAKFTVSLPNIKPTVEMKWETGE